jgi:hypothetical protein
MIVVAGHGHLRADVRDQLCSDPGILDQYSVGTAERVSSARAEVAEVPDRRRDYVQAWREIAHAGGLTSSNSIKKESSCGLLIINLGRGGMIALLGASALSLAALQATISGPTTEFRGCLREAAAKATKDKVAADAIEDYLRNACTVQMGTLKSAVIAFRVKNGMSRKAAADDAEMTVDDYVATPADNYKFMAEMNAPKSAAPAPPAPTPAASPQPPKP